MEAPGSNMAAVEQADPAAPMMDMGMKMYFHVSAKSMILFKGWMTHNWQEMLGSCFGVFLIAILYEGFKVGRELLRSRMTEGESASSKSYPVNVFTNEVRGEGATSAATSNVCLAPMTSPTLMSRTFFISHSVQALLHLCQVWISMCLMLIFMTYNVYLCLAVSLGAGMGYFAFAWIQTKQPVSNEHCN